MKFTLLTITSFFFGSIFGGICYILELPSVYGHIMAGITALCLGWNWDKIYSRLTNQ